MGVIVGSTFVVSICPGFHATSTKPQTSLAFGKKKGVVNVIVSISGHFSATITGTAAAQGLLEKHLGLTRRRPRKGGRGLGYPPPQKAQWTLPEGMVSTRQVRDGG